MKRRRARARTAASRRIAEGFSFGRRHEAFATAAVHNVQARPLRSPVYGALFPVSFKGTGNKPIFGIDSHISTLSILRLCACSLDRAAQRCEGIVAFLSI